MLWLQVEIPKQRAPFLCPKKNAPTGSRRESVVCRKSHQEDLRRFLRLKRIHVMRMVISIFIY